MKREYTSTLVFGQPLVCTPQYVLRSRLIVIVDAMVENRLGNDYYTLLLNFLIDSGREHSWLKCCRIDWDE